MFYYVDTLRCFGNDTEYWCQIGMRMKANEAIDILNKYMVKGWECRLQVCLEDRHSTMEKR